MYVHTNFQDATIFSNEATREEVELFDQPSYNSDLIWHNNLDYLSAYQLMYNESGMLCGHF